MDVLIDNKNLLTYFNIGVLDYTGALSFASERENERVWADKSGVDKNLVNVKYDAKEFVLQLYCKADTEGDAYNLVKVLVDYMYEKGVFVLSLRDAARGIRECYLCERSGTVVPDVHIRQITVGSLYVFKLGLKDVNPNAVKYQETIVSNTVDIIYTKGQTANIYWGDGSRALVSNSGEYSKTDYSEDGLVDIIIDIDADSLEITPLIAEFTADVVAGAKDLTVNFTDLSSGDIAVWAWNFGDGTTSDEQNPTHVYTEAGVFTVTLQVFNNVAGADAEEKIDYISVRNARMLVNDSGDFALVNDSNDYGLIN